MQQPREGHSPLVRRHDLAGAASGPCIAEALTPHELTLDEFEMTTERLSKAGRDAYARVLRALAALEDAAEALDEAGDDLPFSCDA